MNIFKFCRTVSLLTLVATVCLLNACSEQPTEKDFTQKIHNLENESNGKIGISVINTANNKQLQSRGNETFSIQSTVKAIIAGAILKQSMNDPTLLDKKIHYQQSDIVFWSPITEKNVEQGLTISELCAAAVSYSDNTATNLLITQLGGTQAVTDFARTLGDNFFRLDNYEPNMNSEPNDPRDKSTPNAMANNLQQLLFGDILGVSQKDLFATWLKNNTTGDNQIRAGVPKGWVVGDKTGSGSYGITNDIGVLYPPNAEPIIVAIYFIQKDKDAKKREDVVAAATRIVVDELKI